MRKISARQIKTSTMVLVSLSLALLLFATTGVTRASAAENYATPKAFACEGGYNGGSYDNNKVLYLACGTAATGSTIYTVKDGVKTPVSAQLPFFVSDVAPSPDGTHLYAARGDETPLRLNKGAGGVYTKDASWKLSSYTNYSSGLIEVPKGAHIDTDASGDIYLGDGSWSSNQAHAVIKYGPNGNHLTNFGEWKKESWEPGTFYWQLNGLAVSRDGSKIYTVEGGNNRIQIFTEQGNGSYAYSSQFGQSSGDYNSRHHGKCYFHSNTDIGKFLSPYDIGFDGAGNIYVLNTTCNEVVKYNANRQFVHTSGALGGNLPHAFAVAHNGDVYIGQSGKWLENLNDGGGGGAINTVPTITNVEPANNTSVDDGRPLIRAKVSDAEQNLAESNIRLWLDGAEIGIDRRAYDQATGTLSHAYDGEQPLPAGTYTVKVEASDGVAATPTTKTWSFTVPPSGGGGDTEEPVVCDKWASNQGRDDASGDKTAPVQTVKRLLAILPAGKTGCLTAGHTFNEIGSIPTTSGGEPGAPVTIRSEPGEGKQRATYSGQMRVLGADITFTDINFTGLPNRGASHLRIDADRIKLVGNDIKNPMGICIDVGETETGDLGAIKPAGFVLSGNRIHNCGTGITDQTDGDSGAHAIYVVNAQGAMIADNYIYDNQDRGIQLYPDSDGTVVEHNVLDGNGTNLNIGREGTRFSENNVVRQNLITNAKLPPVTGTNSSQVHGNFDDNGNTYGNAVSNNCLWYEKAELRTYAKYFDGHGYVESNNKFVDPLYKNRAGKDFTIQASGCAGMGPRVVTVDPPVDPPVNPAPTIADMVPANGSETTNTRPRLSATVRDDATLGKSNIQLYVDGVLIGDAHYAYFPDTGELWREFETQDTDLGPGAHTFRIVVTDAQGRTDTETSTFRVVDETVDPDLVNPVVTPVSPRPGASSYDRTPTIKATVSDDVTDLVEGDLQLFVGTPQGTTLIPSTNYSYNPVTDELVYDSPRLSTGKKTVRVVATDAAKNEGALAWSFAIRRR